MMYVCGGIVGFLSGFVAEKFWHASNQVSFGVAVIGGIVTGIIWRYVSSRMSRREIE